MIDHQQIEYEYAEEYDAEEEEIAQPQNQQSKTTPASAPNKETKPVVEEKPQTNKSAEPTAKQVVAIAPKQPKTDVRSPKMSASLLLQNQKSGS